MKKSIGMLATALAVALMSSGCGNKNSARSDQTVFATPGDAAVEFYQAVRNGDKARLAALLGPESGPMVSPGDSVQGGTERSSFLQAYDSVKLLVPAGPNAYILQVGAGRWPLPMPIVKTA